MNADDDTKETMLALVQPDSTPTGLAVAGVVDVDHEMVVRARRGDQAAFASLFRKHHGRVYGMCARLLARKPDVEDAVQQTFLEAWRCLGRFEGKSRFTTWLTRIAIYTCFSFRRRLRRLLLVDDAALEGQGLSVVGGALGDGSAARVGDPRSEAAPLAAEFNRRGQAARLIVAVAAAVALQVLGLGVAFLAGRWPWLMPLIYLNPLGFAAGGAYLLFSHRHRPIPEFAAVA